MATGDLYGNTGQDIKKRFPVKGRFSDLSISIDVGQKIGLVGTNGVGKSTLLRILANQLEPDYGEVTYRNGISIGYLPQDFLYYANDTVDAILSGHAGQGLVVNPHGAIKNCEKNIKYKQDIVLSGLGISALEKTKKMGTLSAGEQTKVLLTAIIIAEPDVYLLDEPTNNLDISAQIWLEEKGPVYN